jgi:hypothetical protein
MRASASRVFVARVAGRALPLLAFAAMAVWGVGCLTADGILDADGGGTLSVVYPVPAATTEASQRYLLQAEGVTVESLAISPEHTASAKLRMADVSALGKTVMFKDVKVTRSTEGSAGVLTIDITTPDKPGKDTDAPGPKIGITFPGKVLEASEPGVVAGRHVQWNFPLSEFLSRRTWTLKARYEAPSPGASTTTAPTATSTTAPKAAPKPD